MTDNKNLKTTKNQSKTSTKPDTSANAKAPTEPLRLNSTRAEVTVPIVKKPTFITKTDPNTRQPIKVMMARPVPTGKKYEKGFVQPGYQCKEEYFYVKWMVYELQKKYPQNLYVMFSSVDTKKDGTNVFWWKIIGPDVLKYKFFYRVKIMANKPVKTLTDKDKIFHSDDGVASINNIDWLRQKFKEIGVESSYLGLFVVEFRTDRLFSNEELDNFRNYHGNIMKKFRELNQPKNIDVDYKVALTKLDACVHLIITHIKSYEEYEIRLLSKLVHNARGEYHFYCNGKINRATWQLRSTNILDELEVSLQAIVDHQQNLGRAALRAQEQINAMRPSLLTKKDIDKMNAEMKQIISRNVKA